MSTLGVWVVLLLFLLLRGLFAALEASLVGVSDARVKELAGEGSAAARRVTRLKADAEASGAALRAGMVLAGFTAAAIGVLVPPRMLDVGVWHTLEASWPWVTPLASAVGVALLATVVDLSLRSMAVQRPEGTALALSRLGVVAGAVLGPLVRGLVVPLNLLLKPFGGAVSLKAPPPPLEELEKQLILQAQHAEVDQGAPQLIRSIFELSDKTCESVMVPRTEVVGLDLSTPLPAILQLIAEENHSRLPVYRDDIDHIVGILHVRDLVPMLQNPELIVLEDLLRPVAYVPWVKPIGDLLRDMQRQRIHMAVVVDEYGGFSGIVTLEDILREIVGDIGDEFARDDPAVVRQSDDSLLVDATMPVEEFARAFDFTFPEGDFDTVGGFLGNLAGAIPEVDARFVVAGWTFVVQSKEGPRVLQVKVFRPRAASPGPERRTSSDRLEPAKA
jgi:CBS domain containing-hemolysin-like protein